MKLACALQQGMALIEALMASAVLGVGLLGATQLTLQAHQLASENRQHTVAQLLASEAMDCLHAHAQNHVTACPAQHNILIQGVQYTLRLQATPRGAEGINDLLIRVSWSSPGRRFGGMSTDGPSAGAINSPQHQLEWRSSISSVPAWVGVSSP